MLYHTKALSVVVALIREMCGLKGIGMIRGRSAVSMLFACIMLAVPGRSTQSTETRAERFHPLITAHSGLAIVRPDSSQSSRGATLAQFAPWRTRKKCVLKETSPKINEECNFGSAIPPDRFNTSAAFEPSSRRPASRPPLRC
jgi:hypothetical protein